MAKQLKRLMSQVEIFNFLYLFSKIVHSIVLKNVSFGVSWAIDRVQRLQPSVFRFSGGRPF